MATPVPVAPFFKLNATGTLSTNSATAVLKDGTFVFVWGEDSSIVNDPETGEETVISTVHAQRFYANGEKFGSEIIVDRASNASANAIYNNDPDVVALANGGFAVSWTQLGSVGEELTSEVFYRAFDAAGAGSPVRHAPVVGSYKSNSVLTAMNDGSFVLSYSASDEASVSTEIQRYDATGSAIGGVFSVGSGTPESLATLKNGNYVVITSELGSSIRGYICRPDGTLVDTGGFTVNETVGSKAFRPSVTVLADGRFVVAYTERSEVLGDGSGYSIRGRIYTADGTASGDDFQINITERDYQRWPSLTALPNGGFAVAYQDMLGLDGPSSSREASIRVVTFDKFGQHDSDEYTVVSGKYWDGLESFELAAVPDGRLIITWTSNDSFKNPYSAAQLLDPRIDPLDWVGTGSSDNFVGTRLNDHLSGIGGADRLYGDAGSDELNGGLGADTLDGGTGFDVASYKGAQSGVTASLETGVGTGGEAAGDSFVSIEGLIGSSHNDHLSGNAGDNELAGGLGADILEGKGGNDLYRVDAGDQVIESANGGIDTVVADTSFTLARSAEVENLRTDSIFGVASISLVGSDTANSIQGNAGSNVLKGRGGDDIVTGESGNDKLYGEAGQDVLTGGLGRDIFVFDTKLSKSSKVNKANLDRITDFSVKDDTIHLAKSVFTKLAKEGVLQAGEFYAGTKAHDQDDRIIYNKKTGALYYDADGTGTASQVQIATLSKNLKMTYKDFFVI
ncbi:calcium-binding protein [Microvirga flavescens]|uniref:calcium-binding protein n=1 Tax=Microvirga flavescens TaxID=2249811 RepID=UPI0018E08BCF|nr:calcium-binding protein [Microvirga flavescens]